MADTLIKDHSSPTSQLAQRVCTLGYDSLSEEVLTLARQCVLDWVVVTIAARDEPLVKMLLDEILLEGGNPQATIVGSGLKVTVRQAALVNGSASHALDYDDVNMLMSGHPSVGIMPAVLSLAESRKAGGREMLLAFIAGYDVACRVGAMVAPSHYARGFHATGTVGTFGAAAACAHLLGLDSQKTRTALGIAAAQAAGLKSMFGTMCKPLHAGKASENGLLAAVLANRGFTSNAQSIECPQGFSAAQSDGLVLQEHLADVQTGELLRENLFKFHASCYLTHAAIEVLIRLRDAHHIQPEQIESIEICQEEGADSVCNISQPTTGLEIKFSLRMLAAFAMSGIDTADGSNFTDERAVDPTLKSLSHCVQVSLKKGVSPTWCAASIKLKDGRVYLGDYDSGVPERDLELQTKRLIDKAHALLDARIGESAVHHIVESIFSLEDMSDVTQLTQQIGAQIYWVN